MIEKNKINKLFSKKNPIDFNQIESFLNFNNEFKVIHIVGTNGKGSLSKYLSDNLINNNLKVGTFTSPHILEFNERIKINNIKISHQKFFDLSKKYMHLDNFFAIIFLVAIDYFKAQKIDIAIIEAGIGGKKDITKLLKGEYGILTSIGLDHQKILGNTKSDILKQKLGICHQKMKFMYPSTIDQIKYNKKIIGDKILINEKDHYKDQNKTLAKAFLNKYFNIKKVFFNEPFGRTTIIKIKHHQIILDVAHNQDAFINTLNYLKAQQINFKYVLICYQKTKIINDINKIFQKKQVFWVDINHDDFLNKKNLKNLDLKTSIKLIDDSKDNILIIGSFYFIGKIWKLITSKISINY